MPFKLIALFSVVEGACCAFVASLIVPSDAVLISLIGVVGTFLTAALTLFTAIVTRRNQQDVAAAKIDIAATKENVVLLEKNTNSIKDALVRVTGEAEFAKGLKTGIETVVAVTAPAAPAVPSAAPVSHQSDRIEKTGDDSNKRIKTVETNTDKRLEKVEDKQAEAEKEK